MPKTTHILTGSKEPNHHTLISKGYHLPYNPDNARRARDLRNNMTTAEKELWYKVLQGKNFHSLKFLRQKVIDNFIVDFYCPSLKLAIEIDGESHYSDRAVPYDKNRTEMLKIYGVKIVRFTNAEVMNNLDGVYGDLERVIEGLVGRKS